MTAREEILDRIRAAVGGSPRSRPTGGEEPGTGEGGPVPSGARASGEERVARFVEQATAVQTTVERLGSAREVPAAVAAYLRDEGRARPAAVHGDLRSLDWGGSGIDPDGDPEDDEGPAVLRAFAGVAETGSVCLTSAEAPLRAAFLPDTLVVVLHEEDLTGPYEELWRRARRRWGGEMPSTLVFVAGPSRTADMEQSLVLGAHGPRRLHVLLVREPASGAG